MGLETAVADLIFTGQQAVRSRQCGLYGLSCAAVLPVRIYDRAKQRAFCGAGCVSILRDATFQPETVVGAATPEAYDALLARPDVATIEPLAELPSDGGWTDTPGLSRSFAAGQPGATCLRGDWNGVGKRIGARFLLDGRWDGAAGGDLQQLPWLVPVCVGAAIAF